MLELRAAVAVRGVFGMVGGVMTVSPCADDSFSVRFFLAVFGIAFCLIRLSDVVGDASGDILVLVVTT